MRTHGQICVRTQILHICKICVRMQIWSCVHGLRHKVIRHFSRGNQGTREVIPVPDTRRKEALFRPSFFDVFFFFLVLPILFLQQRRVGRRNKNKNEIHSDHFPTELKSKETRNRHESEGNTKKKSKKKSLLFFFLIFKKMGREGR